MALRAVADCVDLVLVVGDPRSSNSNRLCEVARTRGVSAYLINEAEEIEPDWCALAQTIALTAGASTPEWVVAKCIERLKFFGVTHIEEVVFATEDVVFQLPRQLTLSKNL